MATKTLAQLLAGFGAFTQELFIPRSQFAGTADTIGLVTALKDGELAVFSNDYFNNLFWVYITSGAAIGDIRNISDFTQTGGIITPDIDFHGAPLVGSEYQIWKVHPQDAIDALNDALVSIYPKLYRKIVFEDLGHSLLASNAASGQTDVIVADATLFFVGQEVTIEDTLSSEDCTIASIVAATNTLTMEDNLTNAYATTRSADVTAKSGHYFNLGATIGNSRVTNAYLRADSTSMRKDAPEHKIITSSAGARQIYFPIAVSVDDQTFILEATGRLESVAAASPAGTVTIDAERVDLLYCQAAYHFYMRQANQVSAGDSQRLMAYAGTFFQKVLRDYRNLWMHKPQEVMDLTTDGDY